MAPLAQCPSERPIRLVCRPFGLLGCVRSEGGVAKTHGDHAIALRGSFSPTQSRRFVRLTNALTQSSATLFKASAQSAAIGCGFDRGFAAARQRS